MSPRINDIVSFLFLQPVLCSQGAWALTADDTSRVPTALAIFLVSSFRHCRDNGLSI